MGAHLHLLGLEPVGGEPLMSVTRGQYDAFPTKRHHRPLAGTKLYCLVTEACVNNLPSIVSLCHQVTSDSCTSNDSQSHSITWKYGSDGRNKPRWRNTHTSPIQLSDFHSSSQHFCSCQGLGQVHKCLPKNPGMLRRQKHL